MSKMATFCFRNKLQNKSAVSAAAAGSHGDPRPKRQRATLRREDPPTAKVDQIKDDKTHREDKAARLPPATGPRSGSRSRSRSLPRTDPDPGGGELPPSLLHDPDVDTYEVDKRGRWLEERDEYFYREGRRGEGTEYVGAVPVDPGRRRDWPRVAGIPKLTEEPRMRAPRLRGQEAEADEDGVVEVEMSVFWDLGSSRDLASLVGASGRVEALRQLGYDEREVQDLLKIEPYIGSPDQDPDQAAPARGDDGEDDGSNPARRLATAASNLAKTMTECYSSSGGSGALRRSLLVFGEREAFDEVVGTPADLGPEFLPGQALLGLPLLPGDVPVPGGLDRLERLARIDTSEVGTAYTPDEVLDIMDSLDAAGRAWAVSGRQGSRGTGPRPDPFNPWAWWRERRRHKAEDRAREAERPWAGVLGSRRDATEGFDIAEGLLDPDLLDLSVLPDLDLAVERWDEMAGGISGADSTSSSAASPEELDAYAEEVTARVVQQLGPDPAHGLMQMELQEQRDKWERFKRRTEEREGVPYELGYLLPAFRRGRADLPESATSGQLRGRVAAVVTTGYSQRVPYSAGLGAVSGVSDPGAPGRDVADGPKPDQRSSTNQRPSRQDLVKNVLDGGRTVAWRHGREPPPPEAQPSVTAGDVLEWCNFRLRRLPPAYVARGMSTGQAMLEEVQAWVSRMARRTRRYSSSWEEDVTTESSRRRRFVACVVSDEPDLLGELPCCSSLTGVDIVVVSSDTVQAERTLADCGGVHLHWGALKLGWYLPGSALVAGSAQVADKGGEGRRRQGRRQRQQGDDGRYGGGEQEDDEDREYSPSSDVEQFVREMDQDEGDGDPGGVEE